MNIPSKRTIDQFNKQIELCLKKYNIYGACLISSAILSEFLTQFHIKHEIVKGYIIIANFWTTHVWIEVKFSKSVEQYDTHFFSDIMTPLKKRILPSNLVPIFETTEEIKEHEELIEAIDVFITDRKKFYKILHSKLLWKVWKKVILELTEFSKTIGFYVNLKEKML